MPFLSLFIPLLMGNFVTDTYTTDSGKTIEVAFISHGSVAFNYDGTVIYVDPVEDKESLFDNAPKADFIFYTHEHSDHFDAALLPKLLKEKTVIVCNAAVGVALSDTKGANTVICANDDMGLFEGVNSNFTITAVPAHNHPANFRFHPIDVNNGYVFDFDGLKIYVAGDTEDIPEMKEVGEMGIDIAFLPVNQPYTMTIDQAVNAVKMVSPKIFYPYHFGPTNTQEGLKVLEDMVDKSVTVKIRPLE